MLENTYDFLIKYPIKSKYLHHSNAGFSGNAP
jgi:hypothetical protein